MRKVEEKKQAPWSLAVNAGLGSLIALVVAILLLLGASPLVASGRLAEGWMAMVTVGALFLGSVAGAVVAVKRHGSRALIVGLCEGAILYAVTFVFGAFADVPTLLGEISLLLVGGALLGGMLGGMLCARPKKKKFA